MPLVPMRLVLDHAAENNYGVAALNVNNMEQIQAIMEAAKETDSPVIVQASRGARSYSQDNYLRHLMLAAAELYPEIPIVMHQDHGNEPATCYSAIRNGFTSVMMDGSLMPDGEDARRATTTTRRSRRKLSSLLTRSMSRSREKSVASAPLEEKQEAVKAGRRCMTTKTGARTGTGDGSPHRSQTKPNDFVAETGVRCAGRRDRHQPRSVQVQQEARRCGAEDGA